MKIICDNCKNFEVSLDNTAYTCHGKRDGSQVLPRMTTDYIEERFDGFKKHCKSFEKVHK